MSKYYLDNNPYSVEALSASNIREAMKEADEQATYTQRDLTVYNEDTLEAFRRNWYGTPVDYDNYEDGEDADIIDFGTFGHYDEWQDISDWYFIPQF